MNWPAYKMVSLTVLCVVYVVFIATWMFPPSCCDPESAPCDLPDPESNVAKSRAARMHSATADSDVTAALNRSDAPSGYDYDAASPASVMMKTATALPDTTTQNAKQLRIVNPPADDMREQPTTLSPVMKEQDFANFLNPDAYTTQPTAPEIDPKKLTGNTKSTVCEWCMNLVEPLEHGERISAFECFKFKEYADNLCLAGSKFFCHNAMHMYYALWNDRYVLQKKSSFLFCVDVNLCDDPNTLIKFEPQPMIELSRDY